VTGVEDAFKAVVAVTGLDGRPLVAEIGVDPRSDEPLQRTDKLRSAENQKLTRFSVPASLHRIPMRFVGIGQAGGDGG
jgi:hypothetical protein